MYRKSPPGVPDESRAPTMTSHTKSELAMAGQTSYSDPPEEADDEPDRPDYGIVKFHDRKAGRALPAVISYPATKEPYAVVHTPLDAAPYDRWATKGQHDLMMEHRAEEWDVPSAIPRAIDKARHGYYDDEAEAHGYDSPISYVLSLVDQLEQGIEGLRHHDQKNPHVRGGDHNE